MNAALGYGRVVPPQMMDRGFGDYGMFGGHGVVVGLVLVIIAAIVIALVIWAATRKPSGSHGSAPASVTPSADPALDVARERLARGEIDPDQYVAIVTALRT